MKKKFALPDAYVILFIILALAAVLTWVVPAGEYERQETDSATIVVPGSYSQIDSSSAGLLDVFLAIQEGMVAAAPLIFLVLIIGGSFAVIESTGAIDALILKTIEKTKNKELVLIAGVMILFSIFGALGIVVNAVIAFIPIGIILARSMKFDAIVGVSIIYLGAYSGFATAFLDPLTTGTAQQIAELPIFSGVGYRVVIFSTIVLVTMLYIFWYAKKIQKDPSKGVLSGNPFPKVDKDAEVDGNKEMTLIHKLVLLWLAVGIGIYVYGVFQHQWGLNEMAAIFLVIAVGTALIDRITPNNLVAEFFNGAKGLVYGALIIGMARSIVVILENGKILDTIVEGMAMLMTPFTSATGAVVMFIANELFNFLVTSGSGQAVIVMPIMTPLADIMEVPRQVAVQAYKMGDGFTNIITPTSGVLMACLAVAGVPWTKWAKFVAPLLLIWTVLGAIFLMIGVWMGWGPF
ncbi:YfcC family protein [Edaphobacillus lindanitolerans]|uniref:Uncharacterized membrane protein YfcC, ion transporter superfamily n=1 Tax=Edaphobacillus lindanitolerans TaxID=550447 RepID=A0A1U7PNA3_9BACI|nr:AbgT family transporter [Edaphobacillus lindanitolerans]SIT72465.1 Uncharacterized membrane protein YfcC, ion transporter superfamily [Edaphobacillus lindanitolerans]